VIYMAFDRHEVPFARSIELRRDEANRAAPGSERLSGRLYPRHVDGVP